MKKDNQANIFAELLPPENDKVYWNSMGTVIMNSKTFYKLDENHNLVNATVEEIISALNLFDENNFPDIDKLFKASDYLVSPNANPLKFINNQYFLTTQQEYIKNKIFSILPTQNLIKISGEAGTGKTLLLFDIAKELSKDDKVLIINCNMSNEAHNLINNAFCNIEIMTQDEILESVEIVKEYEYILLDEAQRMYNSLWNLLCMNLDKKIIFTLDPQQVLTKEEIKENINSKLDKLGVIKFKLSNKIRISNNIKEFTYRLFDMNKNSNKIDLSSVHIHYASNTDELLTYFKMYQEEYTYITIPDTNYVCGEIVKVNIDEVVGKDYENVLMVLDNKYFYEGSKLSSHNSEKNNYLYLKILYQGLSRTRDNVVIIIYRNKQLFKDILKNIS